MSDTITIRFHGICTHLIGDSWDPARPKFTMYDAPGDVVPHRVFIAYSELHMFVSGPRCVPRHLPRYRIGAESGAVPRGLVLSIDGVDDRTPLVWEDSFRELPSVWALTGGSGFEQPAPDPLVLAPWTARAQVLFNFHHGVTFAADANQNVIATVKLVPGAALMWDDNGDVERKLLEGIDAIEFTNTPENPDDCSIDDYLLHYVPTTLTLTDDMPVWPRRPDVTQEDLQQEKNAAAAGRLPSPRHDLYCSNSVYP